MYKFLHTADWHLTNTHSYSHITKDNISVRFEQQLRSLDSLCEYALKEGITTICVSGDVYNYSNPTSRERTMVVEKIVFWANTGIRFIIIDGNHDTNGLWSALGYLKSFNYRNIIVVSKGYKVIDDKILAVPWKAGLTLEEVISYVKESKINPAHSVLMLHEAILSADYGNGFLSEEGLKLSSLFDLGFAYVAMGHFHKFQAFKYGNQLICYSGSLMAKDFSDYMHQNKFCISVSLNESKCSYVLKNITNYCKLVKYDFEKELFEYTKIKGVVVEEKDNGCKAYTIKEEIKTTKDKSILKGSIVKIKAEKENYKIARSTGEDFVKKENALNVLIESKTTDKQELPELNVTMQSSCNLNNIITDYCTETGVSSEEVLKIINKVKSQGSL